MYQCTDDALRVAEAPPALDAVGHSMGGLTLLAYALDHPGRIRRLVLVGTGTGGPAYLKAPGALWNRSHPRFARLALLGSLHLILRRLGSEKVLNNFITRQSFHQPTLAEPEPVSLTDWLRPAAGRADWHRVARRLDYTPQLGELDTPALVLCGRHDPQYPPTCSAQLAAGIRGARLEYFDHSGHYPFIEEPQAFWAAVGEFLTIGAAAPTGAQTVAEAMMSAIASPPRTGTPAA